MEQSIKIIEMLKRIEKNMPNGMTYEQFCVMTEMADKVTSIEKELASIRKILDSRINDWK